MRGGERRDDVPYPDDEWRYFVLADKFGWTPTEVDEQPAALLDWLLAINVAKNEIEAEQRG